MCPGFPEQVHSISSRCSRATIISVCPIPAYTSLCWFPNPPTAAAQPSGGGPVRRRWRPDWRSTRGRSKRWCCFGCHRGHSLKRCKGLMITMSVKRSRGIVPAGRRGELREVLKTRPEGLWPADSYHSDGMGKAPIYYPHPTGTRPIPERWDQSQRKMLKARNTKRHDLRLPRVATLWSRTSYWCMRFQSMNQPIGTLRFDPKRYGDSSPRVCRYGRIVE